MPKYVVGIDPDSKANGIAIFENGKLIELHMYNNMDIVSNILEKYDVNDLLFSIENVCTTNHIFGKHLTGNKKVDMAVALRVGRCQQAQIELERLLDHFGVKYRRYKPAAEWKDSDVLFKRITKWEGRSNPDKRSAAYFGWLAVTALGQV
jgi:hypothetical protein